MTTLHMAFDFVVYDDDTVTLVFDYIPLRMLDPILRHVGDAARQSIVDAVNAQKAANSMGLDETRRTIHIKNGKLVIDDSAAD